MLTNVPSTKQREAPEFKEKYVHESLPVLACTYLKINYIQYK